MSFKPFYKTNIYSPPRFYETSSSSYSFTSRFARIVLAAKVIYHLDWRLFDDYKTLVVTIYFIYPTRDIINYYRIITHVMTNRTICCYRRLFHHFIPIFLLFRYFIFACIRIGVANFIDKSSICIYVMISFFAFKIHRWQIFSCLCKACYLES
jgi:hypothetical protein